MPRRRLRLSCSSEDEEDDQQQRQQQQQLQEVQQQQYEADIEVEPQDSNVIHSPVTLISPDHCAYLNPNPAPNTNTAELPQLEISDDDFVDVSDHFDNLSPPSHSPPVPNHSFQAASVPSFVTRSSMSSGCLMGDSLQRLGLNLRREWLDSCISGLERSVPGFGSLDVDRKAKLCFEQFLYSDMNYSGGGVLPENITAMHLVDLAGPFVLQVDEIVNISCPLRGRYQNASSGIKRCLKLSMTDGVQRVFGMEYRPIKNLEVLAPAGLKVAICNVNIRHGLLMLVPEVFEVLGGLVNELDAARQRLVHEVNKPPRGKRTRNGVLPSLATRATRAAWPSNSDNSDSVMGNSNNSTSQNIPPLQANGQASGMDTSEGILEEVVTPVSRGNDLGTETGERITEETTGPNSRDNALGTGTSERITEDFAVPISRENVEQNPQYHAVSEVEGIQMVDEVEHPMVLSGDRETPFTYLASLSAKWAAMEEHTPCVQGKIKCFLTGVKRFQYKQRTSFELRVYVDDGSLISEILIGHSVVQKGIGYSPGEVTAALVSSDMKTVSDMKEKLKQFQFFLANFEGTMLVEINKTSPHPIALDMTEGCPASDAWLLLRRLKSSTSSPMSQLQHLDPIDISP